MIKLPPSVQSVLDTLYGEDKWWRVWAMLMTVCVVLWFPRNTRRLGAIAFISLAIASVIWHYLQTAYIQYTPSDTSIAAPVKKKWLH